MLRNPLRGIAVFNITTIVVLLLPAAGDTVDFNRDIRPVLSDKCFHCHGPDAAERKADLRLDEAESAYADRDGIRVIVPGDAAASELVNRIETNDPDEKMPPQESHKHLSPGEIRLLKQWINEGAEYQDHWAFVAPEKPNVPGLDQSADRQANAIDYFIAQQHSTANLRFSPEADRRTLIRRVTFDLLGLPPTPEEVAAFVADTDDHAYEKVVDRLLRSRHFGERMTLAWMDAARYGDSSVMHADGHRDMWPWRDWVIRAYNDNMPFDQFTIEQLAGDLLPNATVAQRVASGFNRNHATSDEGGAIPEELRVEYVVDRVKDHGECVDGADAWNVASVTIISMIPFRTKRILSVFRLL